MLIIVIPTVVIFIVIVLVIVIIVVIRSKLSELIKKHQISFLSNHVLIFQNNYIIIIIIMSTGKVTADQKNVAVECHVESSVYNIELIKQESNNELKST